MPLLIVDDLFEGKLEGKGRLHYPYADWRVLPSPSHTLFVILQLHSQLQLSSHQVQNIRIVLLVLSRTFANISLYCCILRLPLICLVSDAMGSGNAHLPNHLILQAINQDFEMIDQGFHSSRHLKHEMGKQLERAGLSAPVLPALPLNSPLKDRQEGFNNSLVLADEMRYALSSGLYNSLQVEMTEAERIQHYFEDAGAMVFKIDNLLAELVGIAFLDLKEGKLQRVVLPTVLP